MAKKEYVRGDVHVNHVEWFWTRKSNYTRHIQIYFAGTVAELP